MTLEKFTEIINILQEESNKITNLYRMKVDLIDFADPYHSVISILIKEIYGEEGYDWFSWFCYERDFGAKEVGAWDGNQNPICYDVESLWNYLEEIKKKI